MYSYKWLRVFLWFFATMIFNHFFEISNKKISPKGIRHYKYFTSKRVKINFQTARDVSYCRHHRDEFRSRWFVIVTLFLWHCSPGVVLDLKVAEMLTESQPDRAKRTDLFHLKEKRRWQIILQNHTPYKDIYHIFCTVFLKFCVIQRLWLESLISLKYCCFDNM